MGNSVSSCPAHWTTSWSSHTQRSGQPAVRAGDGATPITNISRNISRNDCALGSGRRRMISSPTSLTPGGQHSETLPHSSLICAACRFKREQLLEGAVVIACDVSFNTVDDRVYNEAA